MKTITTTLLFVFALLLITVDVIIAKDRYVSMILTKIKINDRQVDSLLNKVIDDHKDMLHSSDCYLLLEMVKAENDTNYINIVVCDKSKFVSDDFPIIGYFEIEEQTVLILGKYFPNTDLLCQKQTFSFKRRQTHKRSTIPPPPSMYNPPSYIFLYK